jgi:hypothetical protein
MINVSFLNRFRRTVSFSESPENEMVWDDGELMSWDEGLFLGGD